MPWVTAFSTIGCRSSGGTQAAGRGWVDPLLDLQARAETHLLDARKRSASASSSPSGMRTRVAHVERVAQELAEQQAHPPRAPPDRCR